MGGFLLIRFYSFNFQRIFFKLLHYSFSYDIYWNLWHLSVPLKIHKCWALNKFSLNLFILFLSMQTCC